ncbi:MAG: hypothetical protein KatS3mg117_2955 [Geminicoccaceae bacterium]|nr:MAG: hypothetical protein KatS3mg117_2955 [Geminicoccaceae bacterium]
MLLAIGGSLLGHGAVLAAVLLAPAASPPVPAPALLVELVSEPVGGAGEGGAEPKPPAGEGGTEVEMAPPRAPDPAPSPAEPTPSPSPRELAVERAAPKPAKPARDRPARTVAERTEPDRVVALPTRTREARAGPAGSRADRGDETGTDLGSGRGGSAAGAEGGGEPPGFAPGSADNPLPRYPTVARRRGIEGTVTLEVKVSASGLAEQVALARSSGSALLDEAALEAVRRWRFRPARRGGEPVPGVVTVPITFRLLEPERAALR